MSIEREREKMSIDSIVLGNDKGSMPVLHDIAKHYDKVTDESKSKSKSKNDDSKKGIRDGGAPFFNNKMKRFLIEGAWKRACQSIGDLHISKQLMAPKQRLALDLCHGKGGDLGKFAHCNIEALIAIDISSKSLFEAAVRYEAGLKEAHPYFFQYFQYECDAFHSLLPQTLADKTEWKQGMFGLVSCQFALHYAASSTESLKRVLYNISCWLCKGGRFIATFPDSRELTRRFDILSSTIDKDSKEFKDVEFGNELFKIKINTRHLTGNMGTESPRYEFYLGDHVQGLTEYVIDFQNLCKWAKESSLQLRWSHNIGAWTSGQSISNSDIDPQVLEVLNLYMAVEFEKI